MIQKIRHCAFHIRNDSGFTYIEALSALSIAALIMSVVPGALSFFQGASEHSHNFEVDFLVLDITDVYKEADEIETDRLGATITFKNGKESINYRKVTDRIVRSVDGSGFVTVMYGVREFRIENGSKAVKLSISTEDGEFEETIIFRK